MALAVLYLVLALVAFVGATVIAVAVMLRVQAKRGEPKSNSVDAATVSMLRRRRQRLDRRLGIDSDPPGEAAMEPASQADGGSRPTP